MMEMGGYNQAKEHGKVRSEGKDYVLKDGDVVLFRFNVQQSIVTLANAQKTTTYRRFFYNVVDFANKNAQNYCSLQKNLAINLGEF